MKLLPHFWYDLAPSTGGFYQLFELFKFEGNKLA